VPFPDFLPHPAELSADAASGFPTAPCCTLLRPAAPRRTFRRCLSPFPAVPSRALCSFTRCELTSSLLPPTAFIRPGLAIFDEFRRKFT